MTTRQSPDQGLKGHQTKVSKVTRSHNLTSVRANISSLHTHTHTHTHSRIVNTCKGKKVHEYETVSTTYMQGFPQHFAVKAAA